VSSHPPPDARALGRDHSAYPEGFRDLEDSPAVAYVRGADPPPRSRAVAVVGARAASAYGQAIAERLAGDLARIGFVVVSGLARGIDAAAHRGALEANAETVAVMPSGLDRVTPPHHVDLAERIARQGSLVSEIAAGPPRFRGEFVRRNRLIAAMAAATVVVEATEKSGALSTATVARRLGRAVLAVPGDVDRETARGCHRLLREGAAVCEHAGDVVRAMERWTAVHGAAADRAAVVSGPPEARLLSALDDAPRSLEALAQAAALEISEAMAGLLALEWAGSARALPGQRWIRTPS
jgi:DNA processing protein